MSRAALLAAGAVGAVLATTDCSSSDTGSPSPTTDAGDASQGDGSVAALYRAFVPPDAANTDANSQPDAKPRDRGSVVALYGAFVPPPDA